MWPLADHAWNSAAWQPLHVSDPTNRPADEPIVTLDEGVGVASGADPPPDLHATMATRGTKSAKA